MSHSPFLSVKSSRSCAAQTLVELSCAMAVTMVVLAGAMTGIVSLQKSLADSTQYAAGFNDGTCLVDSVSRDLRNAIRVSRRASGTETAFTSGFFAITETDQLVIVVPDFYQSNVPDNTSGSAYKTPRYSRSSLNPSTGATFFPYSDVVAVIGTMRVPNYPGELEVRYLKRARSTQDPTICYFRQEYDGGATPVLRSEAEVSEKADSARLSITALTRSQFRIVTSFSPKRLGESRRAGTIQTSVVKLSNTRRD
jgi:hypothetical protein